VIVDYDATLANSQLLNIQTNLGGYSGGRYFQPSNSPPTSCSPISYIPARPCISATTAASAIWRWINLATPSVFYQGARPTE